MVRIDICPQSVGVMDAFRGAVTSDGLTIVGIAGDVKTAPFLVVKREGSNKIETLCSSFIVDEDYDFNICKSVPGLQRGQLFIDLYHWMERV